MRSYHTTGRRPTAEVQDAWLTGQSVVLERINVAEDLVTTLRSKLADAFHPERGQMLADLRATESELVGLWELRRQEKAGPARRLMDWE